MQALDMSQLDAATFKAHSTWKNSVKLSSSLLVVPLSRKACSFFRALSHWFLYWFVSCMYRLGRLRTVSPHWRTEPSRCFCCMTTLRAKVSLRRETRGFYELFDGETTGLLDSLSDFVPHFLFALVRRYIDAIEARVRLREVVRTGVRDQMQGERPWSNSAGRTL